MYRRVIALLALLGPAAALTTAEGCATEPLPQDLCSWLSDTNNCYARFGDDVGTRCGEAYDNTSDPAKNTTGYFLDRTDLSICIRTGGGQVIFDPPLEVGMFPPTEVAFTMLDSVAQECGKGSFTSSQSYSITISEIDKDDAGLGVVVDAGIVGGTFSIARASGRDRFDVTCPGGLETHNFNELTVNKCLSLQDLVPTALLDSSPGIPGLSVNAGGSNGYIRLGIEYPPADPNAEGATPTIVQYFNCSIPAPLAACKDGAQNNDETDVDCGGSCNAKCAAGASCFDDADCQSGSCTTADGIKLCA